MFRRVLVRSNILKDYSDAYRNVVTAIMMRMVVVAVAVTKCVTAVLYAATNITQYIDRSTLDHSTFPSFLCLLCSQFFLYKSIFVSAWIILFD